MKTSKLKYGIAALAFALVVAGPSVHAQVLDTTGNTSITTATSTGAATTDTTATTNTATPGLPNTGAGGNAAVNVAILLSSGIVALAAIGLLARRLARS